MNLTDAYRLAWQEAKRRGAFDEAILLRRLDEVTDRPVYDEQDGDDETAWEYLQRLALGLWRDKVPPRRFKRRLRRALRKELFGTLFGAGREIWKLLASARTPRWMRPPRGTVVFGIWEPDEDEDHYDEWQLPWQVRLHDDWNRDLLVRAVDARPKEDVDDEDDDEEAAEPCHGIPVWLARSHPAPLLDVMIGAERLVGAQSGRVWEFLRKIADDEYDGIEGELSVWDPEDNSSHRLDVDLPRKELPEKYVKYMLGG